MTMKKILNEWRKYSLNESNQPFIDQQLGAPDGWFGKWDGHLGLFQTSQWMDYLKSNYPNLESQLLEYYEEEEVREIMKNLSGGFSFYAIDFLGTKAFKDLIIMKLDSYLNSSEVPEEHKDFFKGNYERIMDFGRNNSSSNRAYAYTKGEKVKQIYEGPLAFFGSTTDWFAFGEGFNRTLSIMEDYFSGMELPDSTPAPETEPPKPPSEEMEDRLAAMKAAMERFYGGK